MFSPIVLLQLIDTSIQFETSVLDSVRHPADSATEEIYIVDIL